MDMSYVGPFVAPVVYVTGFIGMLTALITVFSHYQDTLLQRIGATVVAVTTVGMWYHMVDGVIVPRIMWGFGFGIFMIIVGMFNKLPRKKK